MSALPWSKFFWDDWDSDPGLRLCSLAAQGLWMRMLCICARSDPKGYLAINGNMLDVGDVARLAGVSQTEAETLMNELDRHGVFSRDRKGRIYSRRMLRDEKRSNEGRKHVKKRWSQPADKSEENSRPNRGPNSNPSTKKPETRSQSIYESLPNGSSRSRVRYAGSDLIEGFDDLWQVYRRHNPRDEAKAKGRYAELVPKYFEPAEVLRAVNAYLDDNRRRKRTDCKDLVNLLTRDNIANWLDAPSPDDERRAEVDAIIDEIEAREMRNGKA